MKKLTDNSPMPFGKHRGTKMANVPASYLLWVLDNTDIGKDVNHPLNQYIQDNIEVLRKRLAMTNNIKDIEEISVGNRLLFPKIVTESGSVVLPEKVREVSGIKDGRIFAKVANWEQIDVYFSLCQGVKLTTDILQERGFEKDSESNIWKRYFNEVAQFSLMQTSGPFICIWSKHMFVVEYEHTLQNLFRIITNQKL